MVEISRSALDQPEWVVWAPSVQKASKNHTEMSNVYLKVKRNSMYYKLNLFGLLIMFTLFSFSVFMVPPADFRGAGKRGTR